MALKACGVAWHDLFIVSFCAVWYDIICLWCGVVWYDLLASVRGDHRYSMTSLGHVWCDEMYGMTWYV